MRELKQLGVTDVVPHDLLSLQLCLVPTRGPESISGRELRASQCITEMHVTIKWSRLKLL